jgi:hypothetical protein
VIAVDHDQSRPDAQQRHARGLLGLRETRSMPREFDRGAQERGGERI